MIGVFLFSYSFIPSLLQYTRKSSAAIVLVNFIRAHVCITVVQMSDVFYLRLSWLQWIMYYYSIMNSTLFYIYLVYKNSQVLSL